jgi:hypothetical protein
VLTPPITIGFFLTIQLLCLALGVWREGEGLKEKGGNSVKVLEEQRWEERRPPETNMVEEVRRHIEHRGGRGIE